MRYTLLMLLLCAGAAAGAQSTAYDLPLPRLRGVRMVLVRYTSLMPPDKFPIGQSNDTLAYYLIGNDGHATAAYYYTYGYRASKHTFE